LSKRKLFRSGRIRVEGEAQLRAQLGLVLEHVADEALEYLVEPLRWVGGRVCVEQRAVVDLGVDGAEQRPPIGEVAVRGGA
jgi:hypothetical protein